MAITNYQRRPGELEIRILPDGRLIFPAPDGRILELAEALQDVTIAVTNNCGDQSHDQSAGQ